MCCAMVSCSVMSNSLQPHGPRSAALQPGFDPWVGKIPWRRERQPTAVLFPKESHRRRSVSGYSLCSRKESDMTKRLTLTPISQIND